MIKIPKTLKIGGHIVKVIYHDNENLMGESDTRKNSISLDKKLPYSQKISTLIHEGFHMMNSTFGSSQTGHALLDSLSEQMFQFLSDNKLLK